MLATLAVLVCIAQAERFARSPPSALVQHSSGGLAGELAVVKPAYPELWRGKLRAEAKVIGEGQFGRVYEATVKCDGTKVAVKELQENSWHAVEQEVGLMQEFSAYPYFVAYFDHRRGRERGGGETYFIMMELLTGGNLEHVLNGRRRRSLQKLQALALFHDILKGVKLMHDKNIIHRDIKPDNIFVMGKCDGSAPCLAKVGDLGRACQAQGADLFPGVPRCDDDLDEVLGEENSPGKDVFDLGMVLYQLVFGRLPRDYKPNLTVRLNARKRGPEFDIRSDDKLNSLPRDDLVRQLLEGMLPSRVRDRITLADALNVASLWARRTTGAVVHLPGCFYTAADIQELDSDDERVRYFIAEDVPINVMIVVAHYLFNDQLVDPGTGVVVDPKGKIRYLRERDYFPKSLKCGDRILTVNNKPFTSIGPEDQTRFKEGLWGRTLAIKYEDSSRASQCESGGRTRAAPVWGRIKNFFGNRMLPGRARDG